MPKKYDLDSKKQYLIDSYQAGSTFLALAKELECNEGTMRNFLKKHTELRTNPKTPKDRSNQETEITKLHAAGVSAYQMAIDLNIPFSTLARILKKLNLDISHRSKIREDKMKDHEKEVIDRYLAGESEQSIADSFSCDNSTISRILSRNEVPTRFHYEADHTFFDNIDNEVKAYTLGYFAADGCNYSHNNIISITSIDLYIIERFKKEWKYTGPIYRNKPRPDFPDRQITYTICVSSKNMSEKLTLLGCSYRKTFNIFLPDSELLSNNLLKHYIRGLCDGDGSLFRDTGDLNNKISIAGMKNILEPIQKFINDELGTNGGIYPQGNIYVLKYGGNHQVKSVVDFLYSEATIYLPRKYELYKQFSV